MLGMTDWYYWEGQVSPHVYVSVCVSECLSGVSVCVSEWMPVYLCVYLYVGVLCMCMCMCIYIYVCAYSCAFVCVYVQVVLHDTEKATHTHTHTRSTCCGVAAGRCDLWMSGGRLPCCYISRRASQRWGPRARCASSITLYYTPLGTRAQAHSKQQQQLIRTVTGAARTC